MVYLAGAGTASVPQPATLLSAHVTRKPKAAAREAPHQANGPFDPSGPVHRRTRSRPFRWCEARRRCRVWRNREARKYAASERRAQSRPVPYADKKGAKKKKKKKNNPLTPCL